MEKKFVLACLFIFLSGTYVLAQDVVNLKHENHFKQVDTIETEQYTIELSDVHTQQAFCQAKFKLTNKTDDYMLVYPERFLFTFEQGTYFAKQKFGLTSFVAGGTVLAPQKSKSFVTKITEGQDFHVDNFDLEIKDLYIVPTQVEGIETEKFQMPANKNSFETAGFKVNLIELIQRTQGTVVHFSCEYVGNNIGIVDPSKLVVSTEKGEFSNAERKSKVYIMQKGDKVKFMAKFVIEGKVLDMQFATMFIDWKDTFKESEKILQQNHKLSFELDTGLTKSKNR